MNGGWSRSCSGWFVESLATQTLVIFAIRTRRVPFFRRIGKRLFYAHAPDSARRRRPRPHRHVPRRAARFSSVTRRRAPAGGSRSIAPVKQFVGTRIFPWSGNGTICMCGRWT
jgi:hypothetical protein